MYPILIAGAGIAGSALAKQCIRLKLPFTLIEKNAQLITTGAGIALPANAMVALRHMGLGSAIDDVAHQVNEIIYSEPSGKVLSQASLHQPPLNMDKFVALRRSQLQQLLVDSLGHAIHYDTTISKIRTDDDGVAVTFASPTLTAGKYAIVVGADGLHSKLRQLTFGSVSLVDLGVTTWRWICEYPTTNLQPTYMLGGQDAFLAYPIGTNTVYCYAHVFDPNQLLYQQTDPRRIIRRELRQYAGIAKTMLADLPEAIITGRLQSMPQPLLAKDHTALIGDAASACSPMLQQGAACAFEDAVILSELLAQLPVDAALKHYQAYRMARVSWIMQASDNPMKSLINMNSSAALFARNQAIQGRGPLNIQGWRQLLATNPIAELSDYIRDQQASLSPI